MFILTKIIDPNYKLYPDRSSVKCIEVNKEARLSFEKTIQRLPNSLNCSITWHHADASVVSSVLHLAKYIIQNFLGIVFNTFNEVFYSNFNRTRYRGL